MLHVGRAAVIWIAIAGASRAHANPRVGVVARAVDAPPDSAREVEAAVRDAAERAGATPVVAPVDKARARRAAGAVARERLDVFKRARDIVNEGWSAYLQVEPEFAMDRLVGARQKIETILDLDGAQELLADASLRLGAVRQHLGRTADAQAAFALAATLDPEREVGAREFAPDVVAAYQRARGAAPASTAMLEVAGPDGAAIEIDGAIAGVAPLRREIAVGEHVVVARAPGKLAAGQLVAVPPEGISLDIALVDDVIDRALAPGEDGIAIGGDPSALLSATALYGELDEIVVVIATWQGGEPALVGQRCVAPPVACGAIVEVRYPDARGLGAAARELWATLGRTAIEGERGLTVLRDERARRPNRRAGRPPAGERDWYENPWIWIGAGAGVAAVIGAIAIFGSDPDGGFAIRIPPCGFCP